MHHLAVLICAAALQCTAQTSKGMLTYDIRVAMRRWFRLACQEVPAGPLGPVPAAFRVRPRAHAGRRRRVVRAAAPMAVFCSRRCARESGQHDCVFDWARPRSWWAALPCRHVARLVCGCICVQLHSRSLPQFCG